MPSTNVHGPKRAILYARVSSDEQARTGFSLAQQLEAVHEYANREGYEMNEETMSVVRRIFETAAAGISVHWIKRALDRDGIFTPSGRPY